MVCRAPRRVSKEEQNAGINACRCDVIELSQFSLYYILIYFDYFGACRRGCGLTTVHTASTSRTYSVKLAFDGGFKVKPDSCQHGAGVMQARLPACRYRRWRVLQRVRGNNDSYSVATANVLLAHACCLWTERSQRSKYICRANINTLVKKRGVHLVPSCQQRAACRDGPRPICPGLCLPRVPPTPVPSCLRALLSCRLLPSHCLELSYAPMHDTLSSLFRPRVLVVFGFRFYIPGCLLLTALA